MPTKRDYLQGRHQARLSREQVLADWGSGDHSSTRIALANRAFEIYHKAITNIHQVQDAEHRSAMLDKLRSARTTGWGWGVSDLEEAFGHLANNGGMWSDNNTETYFGGRKKCFARTLVSDAPEAMVNFLDAVDDGMEELRGVLEDFGTQAEKVQRGQQRDDWQTVGKALGHIKTGTEQAKPWLWTAPAAEQWAGRVVTFADVAGKIHAGATMYVRSQEAGFSTRESAALTAMRTAVGFVPVLGSFYGKAVEMIPGLVTWFRGLVNRRIQRIERASRGY